MLKERCGTCLYYSTKGKCKAKNIEVDCLNECCVFYLINWKIAEKKFI